MELWHESVHSDGTAAFVSNPTPAMFEDVSIRLRLYEDAPVSHVILRSMPNGMERLDDMHIVKSENGFVYYEATLNMNEKRIQYHFYLVCDHTVYFYTQKEITTYLPDHTYDFVLLADYIQPEWVREAVFYQIFPERFCNGNPTNDVRDGEYTQNGHPTIQMKNWNLPALHYEDAYCLDFFGGDLQGGVWDAPMNYFGCGRVIRQFLGEPDLFMQKHPALRNISYKMTAQDVKHRIMEHLAKLPYVIWENQFNLFDSHDTSRLHNNPKVNPEEYRGAIMFQFMLPGAASIYYGDEAGIDGYIDSMEGCRYPMPWNKEFTSCEQYQLIHTMAKLKANHPALSKGSMKILCAQGNVFAIARFWEQEAFVCVISTDDEDTAVRIPLGAVGAQRPSENTDIFGKELSMELHDSHSVTMQVKAHQSYLFICNVL